MERFHRETKAAARLDHPNIVRAYDAEQAGDTHFLAMEYVEGTSLADYIKRKGPLPVLHACHFIRQAALGLQHWPHEKGMVHRDIKPHNLMMTPKGIVKILDFGLARFASERDKTGAALTQLGAVMGTPDYIAPEQALDSHSADIRADIYSLGCTLYYLLTGQPPYQGGTEMQKMLAHIEVKATPLSEVRQEVPAELEQVVDKMMAKEPGQRYQTPKEVAEALAPFSRKEATPAKEAAKTAVMAQPAVAAPPTVQRRRWLVPAAIAAFLMVGILAGAMVYRIVNGTGVVTTKDHKDHKIKNDKMAATQGGKEQITNSIGMKLVLIPAGKFMMGSPKDEPSRSNNEEQHEVEITQPFYMGMYTVTQAEYERVMGNNPSYFSATGGGKDKVPGMDTGRFPVEMVSWDNAVAFCRKLSDMPERNRQRAGFIACRRRQNGNTPAERGPRRRCTLAIPCPPSKRISMEVILTATQPRGNSWKGRRRWARTRQMLLGCTTCTAMSGSGARTGTWRSHREAKIQRSPHGPRSGSFAAGAGSTPAGSAGPRSATGSSPATGTAALASAWPQFSPAAEPGRARVKPVA